MSERPILFSSPMVRALLVGTKTQTRRVVKLPTKGEYVYRGGWEPTTIGGGSAFTIARDGSHVPAKECVAIWNQTTGTCIAAPYQVGDKLWVREAWRAHSTFDAEKGAPPEGTKVFYIADGAYEPKSRYRHARFMPRWASRLTLEVTDVRVERLRDITKQNAIDEGLISRGREYDIDLFGFDGDSRKGSAVSAYAALWESINGEGSWAANPWVVALTFTIERSP